ncbi:hypothetical protein AXF42_Ash020991 [Apostasia shenzhenica]|uniref:Uncharacterized protein n=1 Tax=Apostasia shenzhenica TaxID=1088818 RepID=A0A2I0AEU4_9ASPA|nr:hypothetical protein AXF42_Ash020991 [Apostasia shenzhenica]
MRKPKGWARARRFASFGLQPAAGRGRGGGLNKSPKKGPAGSPQASAKGWPTGAESTAGRRSTCRQERKSGPPTRQTWQACRPSVWSRGRAGAGSCVSGDVSHRSEIQLTCR